MKNFLSYLIILTCLVCVVSCKNKAKESASKESDKQIKANDSVLEQMNTTVDSDSLLAMITNMTKVKQPEVTSMRRAAEAIIAHRNKESGNKAHIIMDKDLWEFEFIFSGRNMSSPGQLAGYWIDFSEDLTYTYGYKQTVKGNGRYTYSIDTGLLLLIDNSEHIKPMEFEAKVFDQMLVMDGNDIYRDNNYNAKLKRITQRPAN
ncbi:MAG: hypothetical protein AAGA77_23705 [Bacteroidota bacterium]